MDRLLIVGALPAETLPIVHALRHRRPLSSRLLTGTLDGHPVAVLTCGVGRAKATAHTQGALQRVTAHHVISIGTCGALIDTLPIGSVLTAACIQPTHPTHVAPIPWPHVPAKTVITVDEPVWSASRRQRLAREGAHVCEMEAQAVQAVIGSCPFSALKVVSDLAGKDPDDFHALPRRLDRARFAMRAGNLCHNHLLPALRTGLPHMSPAC